MAVVAQPAVVVPLSTEMELVEVIVADSLEITVIRGDERAFTFCSDSPSESLAVSEPRKSTCPQVNSEARMGGPEVVGVIVNRPLLADVALPVELHVIPIPL